jgi:hypothetical protein
MAQSNETMLAMAFSEQVYRRADNDQQIGKITINQPDGVLSSEGFSDLIGGNIVAQTAAIAGFTRDGGFYYNNATGFVGQIIKAGGNIIVTGQSLGRGLAGFNYDNCSLLPA